MRPDPNTGKQALASAQNSQAMQQNIKPKPLSGYDGGSVDYECVSTMDDDFRASLSPQQAVKFNCYALYISGFSLVVTVVLGVAGTVIAAESSNIAVFGFALNCFLDVLSTGFVIWRFWPSKTDISTALVRERERKASFGIGILFVCAFFVITAKSIVGLLHHEKPSNKVASLVLAATSGSLCLLLGWGKLRIAERLSSSSLRTDGFNSLAGAAIALGILCSWLVYNEYKSVWFISFIVALVVAVGMLVCGLRLIVLLGNKSFRSNRISYY